MPRSPRVDRKRRVGLAIAVVLLLAIAALGIQSWRVVSAIVDAERAAVVPLPTRTSSPPFAVIDAAATPATRPGLANASAPTLAAEGSPSVAPVPGSAARMPTSTSARDDLSRLDVVREIVEVGMAGGDPGRSSVWEGRTDLYVLVLGIDRRKDGGDQNADVIILAHLDLIERRVAAVSIPRDLLVEIPAVGLDKINGAYNAGVQARPMDPVAGVAKVRDTIEHVFRIPIDAYVLVDFDGFEAVIDAVGGVDVDVPYEIYDDQYPTEDYGTEVVHFAPGRQQLDGRRALQYVRTRHADSDDARRERQLQVLMALFDKGRTFESIARADRIILTLGDSVQTSFSLEQQLTLARLAFAMERDDIRLTMLSEPLIQPGYTDDGKWIYVGDMAAITAFVHESLLTVAPSYGES